MVRNPLSGTVDLTLLANNMTLSPILSSSPRSLDTKWKKGADAAVGGHSVDRSILHRIRIFICIRRLLFRVGWKPDFSVMHPLSTLYHHTFWRNLIVFLKIKLMRHGRPRSRSSGGRKDRDRQPRINHKQEALRVSLTLVRTACF